MVIKYFTYLFLFIFLVVGCQRKFSTAVLNQSNNSFSDSIKRNLLLVYNSGFESATAISHSNLQSDDISGIDESYQTNNNWVNDLQNKNGLGTFRFYYEQGDYSKRKASIVQDPLNKNNRVLDFQIFKPNVKLSSGEIKARVQAEMYDNINLKEFYQSVRLLLPVSLKVLNEGAVPNKSDWLTLFELWNDEQWTGNSKYPFRISVGVRKKEIGVAGSPLIFSVGSQTYDYNTHKYIDYWRAENTNFEIPFGEWMTIEIYFKEGNKQNGKFYVNIFTDIMKSVNLFRINDYTYHPANPSPDGLVHYSPLKLYASGNLVNYLNANGTFLQAYWDDFKFWKNK